MNGVQDLIRTLEDRDIRLEVVDDRLRVDAPKGALTDELRSQLQERKPELISALRADWDGDARKVIAALPDGTLQTVLTQFYEQTVGFIQREVKCSRDVASQQAFGLLLFQIMRCTVEIPVPSNSNSKARMQS